ncbi:hypothetical protein FIBSPDRAFT_941398 [Athelia psychrophila]|uniref:Uncharacterized protein n=1 Tax=Athelia psychrophila TaxID=1759441 RepID=A0A167U762_9AGAM|nr:hypothetical protein FIBSPDRAFT_941398 [Fibularhizoctonia sp. CBS 109695]
MARDASRSPPASPTPGLQHNRFPVRGLLSIDDIRQAGCDSTKLPVLTLYILTTTKPTWYDGSVIVQKSIDIGSSVLCVSFNHRVNGFGFLAGQENVRPCAVFRNTYPHSAASQGHTLRLSSGVISMALQMLLNGGDGERIFRAAWPVSGGHLPAGSYTHDQKWYDDAVAATNFTDRVDTLACLRGVPVGALHSYFFTTPAMRMAKAPFSVFIRCTTSLFAQCSSRRLSPQHSMNYIGCQGGCHCGRADTGYPRTKDMQYLECGHGKERLSDNACGFWVEHNKTERDMRCGNIWR